MADPNRALFESVVHLLAPLLDELVFVGGCMTGLFITDPAAGRIRPTRDGLPPAGRGESGTTRPPGATTSTAFRPLTTTSRRSRAPMSSPARRELDDQPWIGVPSMIPAEPGCAIT